MHSQNSRKRTRMNFGRESYQLWPRNEGTFSAELGLNVGQSSFILRSKFPQLLVEVGRKPHGKTNETIDVKLTLKRKKCNFISKIFAQFDYFV